MEDIPFEEEKSGEENIKEDHNDRFTDFMFGPRRREQPYSPESHEPANGPSYINYEQLMVNFDLLMDSIQNLKPLLNKFKPFVQQFWKKK
jgi:hypothetical protein